MTEKAEITTLGSGQMQSEMFSAAEVYTGDPLNPDMVTPTPDEIVAALTPCQRRKRVEALIEQAWAIVAHAIVAHRSDREIVARCLLFSGGNDSTTLAHLMRNYATHAVHANTGIGIEQTRQFVRDTCKAWGLPLIERHGENYRDLVLDQGFPGPAMHWKMFTRLKERALDQVRRDLGIARSRTKCALFIAGRRRAESSRREDVPLYEADGSVIWVSPFALWTKLDLATYRQLYDVPCNEVSDLLHMSGECLCGAFAHKGELDEIGEWFPEVKAEIEALQEEVRAAGFTGPHCTWGHGHGGKPSFSGRLCSSCSVRADEMLAFESDDCAGGAA